MLEEKASQLALTSKFKKAGIQIRLFSIKQKTWVLFTVTDSGIGISKDKHQIIFETFQQSDGTTSRKYGGTGFGLSISRQIVYMLGGGIQLQSVPDKGSTFSVYLHIDYVPVTKRSKLNDGLRKEKKISMNSEFSEISSHSIAENESLI